LQNVAKYAQASSATIELRLEASTFSFAVSDDGCGFDASSVSGSGLQGITDRLAAIGGTFEVESAPGAGTTVSGRVPIRSRSSAQAGDVDGSVIESQQVPV
jgi:signal transduction histidine kinase